MILVALALLGGSAAAVVTYLILERAGRASWPAILGRGVAWSMLILLLLNAAFPRASRHQALVLLDASLSMTSAGGHWAAARDTAAILGEVRLFGDSRPGEDSLPDRGESRLAPALAAAAASDRAVIVVTDGETDDAADLPADLIDRASVLQYPRDSVPDYAVTRVSAPDRVTSGDSIPLEVELRAVRAPAADLRLVVTDGSNVLATRSIAVPAGGETRVTVTVPSAHMPAGVHVLDVRLAAPGDAEPRTDRRLVVLTVSATPGVVLVASPGDWDARALYRALTDVAALPVRGYVELAPGRYRSMRDLSPVSTDVVRRATAGADLLILKGDEDRFASATHARGIWRWPSGHSGGPQVGGDWYLTASAGSPVSGAFLGLPLDSFPPATSVTPVEAASGEWVALTAQDRRRGPARPVVLGGVDGRRRHVLVAVDGLWRWAFRGGESEQAYRSWVAATTSWLLAAPDTAVGVARPLQRVVQQGRPVIFEWAGAGQPHDVAIGWSVDSAARTDTLRFDATGRASVWLPPGAWRYRLAEGGSGTIAVETYSDEFLPRPPQLTSRAARAVTPAGQDSVRDWIWIFGVAIAGLALEWWWRRRLGLR